MQQDATGTPKKECTCCKKAYDRAGWQLLPLAGGDGRQYLPADDYGPEVLLELRNCGCGSTISIDLMDPAALPQ